MIRYISKDTDKNLFVVEEVTKNKWEITKYIGGLRRLDNIFEQHFGIQTHVPDYYNNDIMTDLENNLAYTKIEHDLSFCNKFVSDVYFKSLNSESSIEQFLQNNYNNIAHKSSEKYEIIENNIMSTLVINPCWFGIETDNYIPFHEVKLATKNANMFLDTNEYYNYILSDIEPNNTATKAITQPDRVLLGERELVIIEYKSSFYDVNPQLEKMQRQLLLAGTFFEFNFNVKPKLVGINFNDNLDESFCDVFHFELSNTGIETKYQSRILNPVFKDFLNE